MPRKANRTKRKGPSPRRRRAIRGLIWALLAVLVAGSLVTFHEGDWVGWGWDPGLRNAENAFGFVGAVIAKLMAAFLGQWLALGVAAGLLLCLALSQWIPRARRLPLIWAAPSLLALIWAAALGAQGFLAADPAKAWGGWLGDLLGDGLLSLLGRTGSLILPAFLSLLGLLWVLPFPRWRPRLPRLDLRPLGEALAAPFRALGGLRGRLSDRRRQKRQEREQRRLERQEEARMRVGEREAERSLAVAVGNGAPVEATSKEPATAPQPRPARPKAKARPAPKPPLLPTGEGFEMPDPSLLQTPRPQDRQADRREMETRAKILVDKLATFHIGGRVSAMSQGPVVSTFEFEPEAGVKVNQIVSRREDLALALRSKELRLVAPIPGKAAVGVELPNPSPRLIPLREVLDAETYRGDKGELPVALGVDVDGNPTWADLSSAPHLLVAGATGTGKSVCINTLLVSLLLHHTPETLRLFLVDPKMLELSVYNEVPHLLHPVITDNKMALQALNWLVGEMELRYRKLKPAGVRSIGEYNDRVREGKIMDSEGRPIDKILPYVVCVVEEFADLMMTQGKDVQAPIIRLAQMARAVGIHLVLATQRPSVDIIDGVIKANFPSRIAFKVFSRFDSKTILDANGAETLIGRGDMLFMHGRHPFPVRLHGAFVSTEEVEAICEHWRRYKVPEPPLELEEKTGLAGDFSAQDELFDECKRIVIQAKFGSTTMLQRRLRIGYTRASRLMDMLEDAGIVGPHTGSKAREVLVGPEALEEEDEL